YKKGEGWTGTYFGSGTSFAQFTASVESRFYNNSGPAPLFKYVAVGANDNLKNSPDHRFKVYVSNDNFAFREINDTSYDGYSIVRKTMSLQPTDIGGNNTFFKFEGQFLTGIPYQANSVSSVSVLYPRNFDLDGNSSFRFNLQGNNTPRLIEWNNYSPGKTHPLVYDFTNNVRIRADKYTGTAVRMIVPAGSGKCEYFIHDSQDTNYLLATHSRPAMSPDVLPGRADLELRKFCPTQESNKNKLVLLTHYKFMGDYASESLQLKNATSISPNTMVSIQQLYEQFSYGMPHP